MTPRHDKVTLTLKKPLALTKPVQLQVSGQPPSGLEDSSGRLIDGDHNGHTGGNAIALLHRGGATISARVHNPTDVKLAIERSAIDILLERGDLAGLKRSGNPKHPTH